MAASISTLKDDFEDNAVAAAWTAVATGSATVAETGGQARFTLPSSTAGTHEAYYRSTSPYDLASDSFFITIGTMVATGVAATAFFDLRPVSGAGSAQNILRWRQVSNAITARHVVAGVDTQLYTATWNSTTYKYLRIRADATTVYWDSSSNGTSWTNRASVLISALFPVSSLFVLFGATCGNIASPGSFRLDDVNVILPALTTTWRWTQMVWPLDERTRTITVAIDAVGTVQGYIITADGVDATYTPSGNVRYWSGPMDGGRVLTEQASEAAAQAMAVNFPLDGRLDFPEIVLGRVFRVGHRSIDGAAYTLRELYPRRLVQADDIEAESIRALHIAANSITADRIYATFTITGKNIQTAESGARVVLSGDDYGGLIGYGATDTYNTVTGTGTYQILWDKADGKFYAGSGAVVLDDTGINFDFDVNPGYIYLKWYDGGVLVADAGVDSLVGFNYLILNAYNSTGTAVDAMIKLIADKTTPAFSYIEFDIDGYNSTSINKEGIVTDAVNVGTATGAAAGQILAAVFDSGTNTAPVVFQLEHQSSGTPAASFGAAIRFLLESSTTTGRSAGQIQASWAAAADASRKSQMIFYTYDTAARECLRVEASGSAPMIGFLGATAVTRPTVSGSRGGNAALASVLTALASLGLITDSSS